MYVPPGPYRPPPPPENSEAENAAQRVKLIRNDHNSQFIETGEPPQNFVREAEPSCRFNQYPRWAKLIQAKDQVHQARTHPAQKVKCDLREFDLTSLGTMFDVILIDPPWEEYVVRSPGVPDESLRPDGKPRFWTLDDLKKLRIDLIADNPSFVFIWAGDSHLDDARALLNHWGYRRCEDITWLKTLPTRSKGSRSMGGGSWILQNAHSPLDPAANTVAQLERCREFINQSKMSLGPLDPSAVLRRVKEHCLMGLRGLVRRSVDSHFVHANIDTDVIIADLPVSNDDDNLLSTFKPVEMYEIIERFCLGRRKLELFGTTRNERSGWLTLGLDIDHSMFDPLEYRSWFENVYDASTWDGTSGTDGAKATSAFLGFNPSGVGRHSLSCMFVAQAMSPVQTSLFRAGMGMPNEQSAAREENPLENKNAYPHLTDYRGGKYEGTSPTLEFLRPKSPPLKSQPQNPSR